MAWVKVDDQMADHPKFTGLDRFAPLALALQLRAFCYASRHLTDGFLPAGVIPSLIDGFESWGIETGGVRGMFAVGSDGDEFDWPAIMVSAGLWEQREGGYVIHDYLDYNPSKEQVLKHRKEAKERMQQVRTKFARTSEEVFPSPSPSPKKVKERSGEYPTPPAALSLRAAPASGKTRKASKEKPRRALHNAPADPEKVCEALVPCLEAVPTPLGREDGASEGKRVVRDYWLETKEQS